MFPRSFILLVLFPLSACMGMETVTRRDSSEANQVAQAAQSAGDHAEAARLYERAAETNPDSPSALVGLGRSYIALGQFSRAENALLRAKELDKRNPEILNQLGTLALHRNAPEAGFNYFQTALGLDRRNLGALTGKGVTLDYLSRHADAQAVYEEALRIYPTNFVLLNNKALSQVLSGQGDAGIALLQELSSDPNLGAGVHVNLAIAHALEGRPKEARAALAHVMPPAEADRSLRNYAHAREARAKGEPIGHLIFR